MYLYKDNEIKTSIDEMTIKEFEKLSAILNDDSKHTIEKYFDALVALGVHADVLEDISDEDFFEIVKSFDHKPTNAELVPFFEHEGKIYRAYTDKFSLKARDLVLIEKYVNSGSAYFASIIGVLFKCEGESPYDPKSVAKRIKIAKELNAGTFYPYVIEITSKLLNKMQKYAEQPSI